MDSGHHGLVVTIEEVLYPVTDQVIHQVFDSYGKFEILDVFSLRNGDIQALIWFQYSWSAMSAKISLQGRSIYTGGCHLNIEFYNQNISTPSSSTHADMVFDEMPERTDENFREHKGSEKEEMKQGGTETKIQVHHVAVNKSGQPKLIEEVTPEMGFLTKKSFNEIADSKVSHEDHELAKEEGNQGRTVATIQSHVPSVIGSIETVMVLYDMLAGKVGNGLESQGTRREDVENGQTNYTQHSMTIISNTGIQNIVSSPFTTCEKPSKMITCLHVSTGNDHQPCPLIFEEIVAGKTDFGDDAPYPSCFPKILPPFRPPSQPPDVFQNSGNTFITSPHVEELCNITFIHCLMFSIALEGWVQCEKETSEWYLAATDQKGPMMGKFISIRRPNWLCITLPITGFGNGYGTNWPSILELVTQDIKDPPFNKRAEQCLSLPIVQSMEISSVMLSMPNKLSQKQCSIEELKVIIRRHLIIWVQWRDENSSKCSSFITYLVWLRGPDPGGTCLSYLGFLLILEDKDALMGRVFVMNCK